MPPLTALLTPKAPCFFFRGRLSDFVASLKALQQLQPAPGAGTRTPAPATASQYYAALESQLPWLPRTA